MTEQKRAKQRRGYYRAWSKRDDRRAVKSRRQIEAERARAQLELAKHLERQQGRLGC